MKIPSIEPIILLSLAVVTSLIWGFWEIAEEVMEGDTHEIDSYILLAMRNAENGNIPLGPSWFQETMRDISALGGNFVLSIFTICAAVYFLVIKNTRHAIYVFVAITVGMLTSNLLKLGFDRPRPDLVPHATEVYTSSFPSSHSMMSAVVYLTLGALLAKAQPSRKLKIYFISISLFLTFLVGISRIYLGVHWPSDVVAGWLAGLICATLFWTIEYRWVSRSARA